ncbi:transposase, partial [Enterococcus avium]
AYAYYQEILQAFHDKEADIFFQLVKTMPKSVPRELHHIKKAFINYESGIRLALELPYSNAKIENLHTHIKALKRIAYGFRSFRRMRTRIFLI